MIRRRGRQNNDDQNELRSWRFSRAESFCPLPNTVVVSPFSLQHLALDVATSALLHKMVQHSGVEGDVSYLDPYRPTFEDYLRAHIPPPFHDALCIRLVQRFAESCSIFFQQTLRPDRRRYQMPPPKEQANQLVRQCQKDMARIRREPHQTLRIEDLPLRLHGGFIELFAPLLTGMRTLDLSGCEPVLSVFYELSIWSLKRALRQLPLLEELIMPGIGAYVIDVLADCCPLLRRLDVSGSLSISDSHLPRLAALDRLQEVRLHGTSFTVLGYSALLRALPQLRDMGSDSRLIRRALPRTPSYGWAIFWGEKCLEKQPVEVRSNARLQLLERSYPSVKGLLIRGGDDVDLQLLEKLTEIRALKLVDFGSERVGEALRSAGRKLQRLTVEGAHCEESLSELRALSVHAPALVELELICVRRASGRIDELPSPAANGAPPIGSQPQEKLITWLNGIGRLQLECENACLVEFLLTNCVNVKGLRISSRLLQTGAMVERVMERNPMSRLEMASFGPDVPVDTARNLVEKCGNLRALRLTYRGEESVRARYEGFREEWRAENTDGVRIHLRDECIK